VPAMKEDLETRLAAGEWLSCAEAAVLLGVSRRTAYTMTEDRRLGWKPTSGGRRRVIDPESLRARIADNAAVRLAHPIPPVWGER
jgi:excisionase family DNA binding protein